MKDAIQSFVLAIKVGLTQQAQTLRLFKTLC